MNTSDFHYQLPPELIAQSPAPERTQARMLVLHRATGNMEHRQVHELPSFLDPGDLFVLNDTRVIPARIYGHRIDSGGKAEALLVEPSANEPSAWEAMVRITGRLRPGLRFAFAAGKIEAEIAMVHENGRVILRLRHDRPLPDILDEEGVPPLPPYIRRPQAEAEDRTRYQTVYARYPGAVAAPTAGLHFTPELLARLETQGIRRTAVTLHVGPGTFVPVSSATVEEHQMESERYVIPQAAAELVNATRATSSRIVAVGSTVVRTLETGAGADGRLQAGEGRSGIFIHPPYTFKIVRAMLTNFHLPQSTLLMMVCALAGYELTMRAYQEAVRERYRFYSYGDCMLIL